MVVLQRLSDSTTVTIMILQISFNRSDFRRKMIVDVDNDEPIRSNYWQSTLKHARRILAPMVDQSELAFRMMCRAHGADLCYTPMIHAHLFVHDTTYRRDNLQTCANDRPLIVQFCANNIDDLVDACRIVAPYCDGVDLNLGCPQSIARKGHYGAFLQDEWPLIESLVSAVHRRCPVPISCKIRIFDDVQKTIDYARMLENAGCQLLTVHGRTREQKGVDTGIADWTMIRAVKAAVNIPVFANGNIMCYDNVDECIRQTHVDGVMSAEGMLSNPYLFDDGGLHRPTWIAADEYLDYATVYTPPISSIRAHLFKFFHHSMVVFDDLQQQLGTMSTIDDFRTIGYAVRDRCAVEHERYLLDPSSVDCNSLMFPHWICQPYIRPSKNKTEQCSSSAGGDYRMRKRARLDELSIATGISRRQLRKLERRHVDYQSLSITHRNGAHRRLEFDDRGQRYVKCTCGSPIGSRCDNRLCKNCCRNLSSDQLLDCTAHHFNFTHKTPVWIQQPVAIAAGSGAEQ